MGQMKPGGQSAIVTMDAWAVASETVRKIILTTDKMTALQP
jgi:hypothetical protein